MCEFFEPSAHRAPGGAPGFIARGNGAEVPCHRGPGLRVGGAEDHGYAGGETHVEEGEGGV